MDIPRFGPHDEGLALLREGYEHWAEDRRRSGLQTVQTRLGGQRVTTIVGPAAAQLFYEEPHLERSSALPQTFVRPLFGAGPVHTLDGEAHTVRKSLFNGVLDVRASSNVAQGVASRWEERSPSWHGRVDLFEEISTLLFDAVASWVGLPSDDDRSPARSRDCLAMVAGFGTVGPANVQARLARRRSERWVREEVARARSSQHVEVQDPLHVVAAHRDADGELLSEKVAAVEVLNLVRPLVAVSWLASGAALAFDSFPEVRQAVLAGEVTPLEMANEVRRYYPFVPFLAARAKRDLEWDGHRIPARTLLVLDVWGTNHDERAWERPYTFDPTRYRRSPVTAYNLVPQGGGHRAHGHRCPGEDMVLAVLMTLCPRLAQLPFDVVGPRPGLQRMPPEPRCVIDVRG